jgi:hypothetical protein
MNQSSKYFKLLSSYLGIFTFGFVIYPKLIGILMLALITIIIIGYVKKHLIFSLNKVSGLFILLYLAFLIGVIFTNNYTQSLIYLENKLSFLFFPLLFSFRPTKEIKLNLIFMGFILGTLLITLMGVISGLNCYLTTDGGRGCLLASSISPYHHPTYLTAYIITSIAMAIKGLKEKWIFFNIKWVLPLVVFFILMHGLLLSLSGILFLFIAIAAVIIYWIKKTFSRLLFYSSIIVLPLTCYFAITNIPQVNGEWYNAKFFVDEYLKSPSDFVKTRVYPMSGTEVRICMWTVSIQIFNKYPYGVGTGNVDEYLSKGLIKLNQRDLSKKMYNPHNQFLQTGIEIGFLGLMIFVLIIGYSIYLSLKFRNWILLLLATNLFFNSLFESMMQRQSGIVFYSFWICLLVSLTFTIDNLKSQELTNNEIK